jgi:hypothetical protein
MPDPACPLVFDESDDSISIQPLAGLYVGKDERFVSSHIQF